MTKIDGFRGRGRIHVLRARATSSSIAGRTATERRAAVARLTQLLTPRPLLVERASVALDPSSIVVSWNGDSQG
jgi:hypothetical protein